MTNFKIIIEYSTELLFFPSHQKNDKNINKQTYIIINNILKTNYLFDMIKTNCHIGFFFIYFC